MQVIFKIRDIMKSTNFTKANRQNQNTEKERQRNFTWEQLYAEVPVEEMPWYFPALDADIKKTLDDLNISSGSFLDLGTGPATKAIELRKMGFKVTGTDISKDAVERASKLSDEINFIHDDILHSNLAQQFDFIFDRGCFHVMSEEKRPKYVETVWNLLNKNGLLFLKCFSNKEPDFGSGPYRFTKEMITQTFSAYFDITKIFDSEFEGNRKPNPKALFVVMRKK